MCIRDRILTRNQLTMALDKNGIAKRIAREVKDGYYVNLGCLLYTSDAADERSSVDLGGRRIIKKKNRYERDGLRIVK